MNKISAKELRVVRMTARMLVFVNKDGQEFFASKRVANEILSGKVDEVFLLVKTSLINKELDTRCLYWQLRVVGNTIYASVAVR